MVDTLNLATREGIQSYLQSASNEELKEISTAFKVNIDELPGDTSKDKAQELIAYLDRRRQLPELILATMKSYVSKQLQAEDINSRIPGEIHLPLTNDNGLDALNFQMQSLRQQVEEVRKQPAQGEIINKLDELERTVDAAHQLSADIVLPPPDSMAVRLVPIQQIERLEEYRSDENWLYLLIGAFLGGIFGILSNWANTDKFELTRYSIVLMIILLFLTVLGVLWAIRLKKRAQSVVKAIISKENSSHQKT